MQKKNDTLVYFIIYLININLIISVKSYSLMNNYLQSLVSLCGENITISTISTNIKYV